MIISFLMLLYRVFYVKKFPVDRVDNGCYNHLVIIY